VMPSQELPQYVNRHLASLTSTRNHALIYMHRYSIL
jgi:hypothetical protein